MENRGIDHSVSITMKYYAHISVPDKESIQELLDRIFLVTLPIKESAAKNKTGT